MLRARHDTLDVLYLNNSDAFKSAKLSVLFEVVKVFSLLFSLFYSDKGETFFVLFFSLCQYCFNAY